MFVFRKASTHLFSMIRGIWGIIHVCSKTV